MIPSRPIQRRLAIGALALLGLAACGGGGQSGTDASADLTVASTNATGSSDVPTSPTTDSGAPSGGSSADTTAAPSGATTAPGTTQPGATATTAKPGASTTTIKPSATTTVNAAATTTVRSTPTTNRPPSTTTPPAPPTTKPVATPGTFTATVANKSHRTLNVPYNSTVVLTVTSATDEEFHVHGYDITKGGTNVTFVFTADMKGSYVVESHDTGWVVCTLVVA